MNKGFIRSVGKYAITIQNKHKQQFYGHYNDIVGIDLKNNELLKLQVLFDIDKTRYSGKTLFGLRYYAINICQLDTIEI